MKIDDAEWLKKLENVELNQDAKRGQYPESLGVGAFEGGNFS